MKKLTRISTALSSVYLIVGLGFSLSASAKVTVLKKVHRQMFLFPPVQNG